MNDSAVYGAMPPAPMTAPAPLRFTLFSTQAVSLATFLGTVTAGALLMAVNYQRLGKKGSAALTLAIGILAGALEVLLFYVAPSAAASGLGVAFLVGMGLVARKLQGPVVEQHKAAGGTIASPWAAAGVGLAFLCVVALGVAVPIFLSSSTKSKVIVGTKDEVFYTGKATRQDAVALGDALKKIGYFQDKGTSVFVDKGLSGTTVSLVQHEGVWDQPEMLANAEEVVREVAYSIGGFPVNVKLINSAEDVKKTGLIGRAVIGTKDEIFYEGTASEDDAKSLGQALQSDKYFQDRGTSVMLSKDGRGTVISYVVADGIWNDEATVEKFQIVTKDIAQSVGGLPVTMRLVSTGLDNKKEVKVS